MKRKALTTALLAGIAGSAGIVSISSAVNMNMDGVGQVLIYPFYTVNNGNDTLISVVNTTREVKAVKVRFLESRNSNETLDFNLYLSPFDVWVAALTDDGGDPDTGTARIIQPANETTCTVPQIPEGGQAFLTTLFREVVDVDRDGVGDTFFDTSEERTREGHFEMIEMGVVDERVDPVNIRSPGAFDRTPSDRLESSAIHGRNGGTPDCAALVQAWTPPGTGQGGAVGGGVWAAYDEDHDVRAPTGGLFGGASIINVSQGYQVSYNADAIESFYVVGALGESTTPATCSPNLASAADQATCAANGNQSRLTLHTEPGTTVPDLFSANTRAVYPTGSALQNANAARTVVFFQGRAVQSDWINSGPYTDGTRVIDRSGLPDAVSALYMRSKIHNEYVVDEDLNASTEWVVTFPTKRAYVAQDFVFNNSLANRPFTEVFGERDRFLGACEEVRLFFYDREENVPGSSTGEVFFSPRPPGGQAGLPRLCQETQVITFGQDGVGIGANPSQILGSANAQNFAVDEEGFRTGWATIAFDNDSISANRNTGGDRSAGGRFLGSVDDRTDQPATFTSGCPTGARSTRDRDNGFFANTDCYTGLPVTGFSVQVVQNNSVGESGALANYAGLFGHRAERNISGS